MKTFSIAVRAVDRETAVNMIKRLSESVARGMERGSSDALSDCHPAVGSFNFSSTGDYDTIVFQPQLENGVIVGHPEERMEPNEVYRDFDALIDDYPEASVLYLHLSKIKDPKFLD